MTRSSLSLSREVCLVLSKPSRFRVRTGMFEVDGYRISQEAILKFPRRRLNISAAALKERCRTLAAIAVQRFIAMRFISCYRPPFEFSGIRHANWQLTGVQRRPILGSCVQHRLGPIPTACGVEQIANPAQ